MTKPTPPIEKPASVLNRESWLTEVAKRSEPLYRGMALSPYRITCGWPSSKALGKRARAVGECHGSRTSKAGLFELFISPVLDDPIDVAGTICHELAHVAAGIEAKHGKVFVEVCRHVGLTKGRATSAGPGKALEEKLREITRQVGGYPHQAIVPTARLIVRPRSSFSLECSGCGYKITVGRKWLEAGTPTCVCGVPFAAPDLEGEEGDGE